MSQKPETKTEKKDSQFTKATVVKTGETEAVVFERISAWSKRHSPTCLVCNHAEVGEIENLFMDWRTLDSISGKFKIDIQSLRRHFAATKLTDKRDCDRVGIYKQIVRRAMFGSAKATIGDAIAALQHLDKLEGKVVDKSEVTVKSKEDREKEYAEILKLVPKQMGEKKD